jgi:mono/diheme cytochrome c family protein
MRTTTVNRTMKTKKYFALILMWLALPLAFTSSPVHAEKKNPYKPGDPTVYDDLAKAPRKAIERRNPMANDPDAVAAGANLFDQHCAECHGDMAEGGKKGPSLRADPVQQATPGTIFWILTNGVVRRGMPVWSKLPEPERWQLVSYVKSLAPDPKPPQQ